MSGTDLVIWIATRGDAAAAIALVLIVVVFIAGRTGLFQRRRARKRQLPLPGKILDMPEVDTPHPGATSSECGRVWLSRAGALSARGNVEVDGDGVNVRCRCGHCGKVWAMSRTRGPRYETE